MTIEQLMRAHRELALMMGYQEGPRQNVYSYQTFMDDLNTVHPGCVDTIYKMWDVMAGRNRVPNHWEKPVTELLELAMKGMTHPPAPGPFWHPQPTTSATRELAAKQLDRWLSQTGMHHATLADRAEIPVSRVSRIRTGKSPMLPTEIDRLAVAFDTDRKGFLAGPLEQDDEEHHDEDDTEADGGTAA